MDTMAIAPDDPRISLLQGGRRRWWDQQEGKIIPSATVYIPWGCPDWGETKGKRNQLCAFCALPNAVIGYRKVFYDGQPVPDADHILLFGAVLEDMVQKGGVPHTLMIFNAGSFLAMSPAIQTAVMQRVVMYPGIQRVVVEARAALITDETIQQLINILYLKGMSLTVRIGVETQDDDLRNKVLMKGHGRRQLYQAVTVMRKFDVQSGGYALLNPAPGLDPEWAIEEAQATLDWILGNGEEQLGMDEAYFCSTNVGPDTPLTVQWQQGTFQPANLWMVLKVLLYGVKFYGQRVHALPFTDEPPLLAVPSNHMPEGLPQDLSGAEGCDLLFHQILGRYRETMDPSVLQPPECACRPEWFSAP